ncbi:hypothetical protein HYH03_011416 [Edaphochlamys debaryana]|uniref:carotenoid 9,10-dioxygenase n=1 Tax=Edaphochlamys debaryana TaxID=47281 RepID=A0A835XUQ2_9CHLO|nr:hypothetical protein HYH03_011416 [Edaphochlamys debaryana]|eukprot:KAG2490110.1 hypothetical protein HYH03_011416 [Edaphochlamys debaryana]
MATASSSGSGRSPLWLHVAVPATAVTTTLLLYSQRTRIMSWMYDAIAKATSKEGAAGKAYLSGNFGPVQDELFAQDLPVIDGKLPYGLDGCYARVGPNPFFEPTAGYHWFDGDGMIHAVRIRNGKASYCNRYIETDRLKQERAAGRPLFIKLGDLYGKRGIALLLWNKLAKCVGAIRTTLGSGTANTALVYHAGRLLSLNEGDLPYGLRVLSSGLVETLGRLKVDKAWKTSFTAHPKVDAATGELLFMGYSFARNPYVTAGVLDEQGKLTKRWGVELPYPTMMHDMAATKNYIVLLHFPLCFDGEAMVRDGSIPFRLRTDLPTRMGLVKRDQPSSDKAEVTWFELPGPGAMAFHVANAWEDAKGDVKIYACQMDAINLDLDKGDLDKERPMMTEYTLSPATGTASARRLTEVVGDFPVIHPGKSTLPCRYSWVATMDTSAGTPSFTGIAKIDLGAKPGKDACCGKIVYPPGCYGGEAVYVPRATTIADPKWASRLSEDDGWLMVYLYDSKQDVSYMAIYDARTMDKKPVCRVRLPRRVPYGFHGTWVTEPQLKAQVMWV